MRLRTDIPVAQDRAENIERVQDVQVGAGSELSHSVAVNFDKPGYYHVLAAVTTATRTPYDADGSPLQTGDYAQAWVLVTPSGGRIDFAYDTTVGELAPYGLSHGSTGEFRKAPQVAGLSSSGMLKRLMTGMGTGTVEYLPQDTALAPRRPVPGTVISGYCRDAVTGLATTFATTTTDALGQFTIYCNPGESHFIGNYFFENSSAAVPDAHTAFRIDMGTHLDISVAGDRAARVYILHNRYATSCSYAVRRQPPPDQLPRGLRCYRYRDKLQCDQRLDSYRLPGAI